MRQVISNAWNLFEIAYMAGWGLISAHMGKMLSQQVTVPPADPAMLLFTVHQAASVLFWGSLGAVIIKAIDSPLQRMLSEWAGSVPTMDFRPPINPVDNPPPQGQAPKP